jgi:uroporphyrinogen-III synthase
VGVTRSRTQASQLVERLREAGADPVELPILEFHPPSSWDPLDRGLDGLNRFDGVVFTSVNAVERTLERAAERGLVLAWSGLYVAASGSATAAALEARGVHVDLIPPKFHSESLLAALLEEFGDGISTTRWLLPRAEIARAILPDGLSAAGAQVVVAPAYRTASPADPGPLQATLRSGLDVLTFASGSSVKNLVQALGPVPETVAVASIGPVTSRACVDAGLAVAVEAKEARIDSLVDAIVAWSER